MGSTLESALVFPVIILFIICLTVWPVHTVRNAYCDLSNGAEEIDERNVSDTGLCTEELNTFLSGVSDNYRMVYGGIFNGTEEEG